jgi:hypothetical protein
MSVQPVTRPLPTRRTTQSKCTQTFTTPVGFEPTTTEFQRVKRVHTLDRATTVSDYRPLRNGKYYGKITSGSKVGCNLGSFASRWGLIVIILEGGNDFYGSVKCREICDWATISFSRIDLLHTYNCLILRNTNVCVVATCSLMEVCRRLEWRVTSPFLRAVLAPPAFLWRLTN